MKTYTVKTYTIRDVNSDAFLKEKLNLIDVTQKDGDWRKQFVFEDAPIRRQLVNDYWSGQGSIPPKKLIDNLRGLRDRMFAEKMS